MPQKPKKSRLSSDPVKRAAQLANLRPGANTTKGAGRRGGVPKGTPRTGFIPKDYKKPERFTSTCRLCAEVFTSSEERAAWCSGACRTEARRLEAILAGKANRGRYETLAHRLAAVSGTGALATAVAAAERIRELGS